MLTCETWFWSISCCVCLCVYTCVGMYSTVCIWRSEDNSQESVLFLHPGLNLGHPSDLLPNLMAVKIRFAFTCWAILRAHCLFKMYSLSVSYKTHCILSMPTPTPSCHSSWTSQTCLPPTFMSLKQRFQFWYLVYFSFMWFLESYLNTPFPDLENHSDLNCFLLRVCQF